MKGLLGDSVIRLAATLYYKIVECIEWQKAWRTRLSLVVRRNQNIHNRRYGSVFVQPYSGGSVRQRLETTAANRQPARDSPPICLWCVAHNGKMSLFIMYATLEVSVSVYVCALCSPQNRRAEHRPEHWMDGFKNIISNPLINVMFIVMCVCRPESALRLSQINRKQHTFHTFDVIERVATWMLTPLCVCVCALARQFRPCFNLTI